MATLKNSTVGCLKIGRTCASSNGDKTVRLGACDAGDGGLKTAVGYCASTCASGAENTAFGSKALQRNEGGCNTGIGVNTLSVGTGNCNTAVGHNSLKCLTTGGCNVGVGYYALKNLTTGSRNVAVGSYAGRCLTTGCCNVNLGYNSRFSAGGLNNNVLIGDNTSSASCFGVAIGSGACVAGTCAIAIGQNASAGACIIQWGGSMNNACNCVWASWSYISDCRDKTDVADLDDNLGINLVRKLKPVSYRSDIRKAYVDKCNFSYGTKDGTLKVDKKHYGFIAQDVLDVTNELNVNFDLIKYNDTLDKYSLTYSQLVASIVKTIKTIDDRIKVLKTKI